MKILFFNNGQIGALDDVGQVPELQISYIELYANFLESKGIDPTLHEYYLPDGKRWKIFKTPTGWNWRMK